MPTQKLRIRGLRAEDEARIAARLRQIDGVFAAALSHQDACAEVEFEDDRASLSRMQAAVAEFGYRAEIAG